MFDKLVGYHHIGWDFDDTLMGHPYSRRMWDFISRNPYDQKHSIVTMRSHGWQDRMFDELTVWGSPLHRGNFVNVINVPDDIFSSYRDAIHQYGAAPADHDYFTFKGEQCARNGIDVLIDDMEAEGLHKLGCEIHSIPHLHPDELL